MFNNEASQNNLKETAVSQHPLHNFINPFDRQNEFLVLTDSQKQMVDLRVDNILLITYPTQLMG